MRRVIPIVPTRMRVEQFQDRRPVYPAGAPCAMLAGDDVCNVFGVGLATLRDVKGRVPGEILVGPQCHGLFGTPRQRSKPLRP